MNANQILELGAQALVLVIFAVVAWEAIRRPQRAKTDIALLLGCFVLIVGVMCLPPSWLPRDERTLLFNLLIMTVPYLQARLVAAVSRARPAFTRTALWGCLASEVTLVAVPEATRPGWLTVLYVTYFVGLQFAVGLAFIREARRAPESVTSRRMAAVAWGSCMLGLEILLAGLAGGFPQFADALTLCGHLSGLACSVGYFIGFAPPRRLRHAWQEPELRRYLAIASKRTHVGEMHAVLKEIETGAALATGASNAMIALWDDARGVLRYRGTTSGGEELEAPPDRFIAGRVFTTQRACFAANAPAEDPDNAAAYRDAGATAILAAPITAGTRRLGVLSVYSERAPMFAEDDLQLVQLLADQAALALECRVLIDEAAAVQARQEVTRVKEDFLSNAAHDLKSPLTAMVLTVEVAVRKAQLNPEAPADPVALERIARSAKRLQDLVLELLDATQADGGKLATHREQADLLSIVRDVCAARKPDDDRVVVQGADPVVGQFDVRRMKQLFGNLVENALKYSPEGGKVFVRVDRDGKVARASVRDHGIGIPARDLPHVFERFKRASNVSDRKFTGMGLGLHICRGIVTDHGGRIEAASLEGQGTTFTVELPLEFP